MNQKYENSRHLIVTKNTPISLSQLLGRKTIPGSSLRPQKYIITIKPRSTTVDSKFETNTVKPSSNTAFHKIIISAANFYKEKSMNESSFILRKTLLEKIDELSEGSLTTIESKICDLKFAETFTDIQRLRGGWGKRCKKSEDKHEKGFNEANEIIEKLTKVESKKHVGTEVNLPQTTKLEKRKRKKIKYKPVNRKQCLFSKFKKLKKEKTTAKKEHQDIIEDQQNFEENKKPNPEIKPCSSEKLIPKVIEIEKFNYHNATINLTPLNKETCAKIDDLEKQLNEMALELRDIKQEMLDPYDFLKIKFLSQQFREVIELLMELKVNCLKCRNIQISEESKISFNFKQEEEISANVYLKSKLACCGKCVGNFNQKPTTSTGVGYNDPAFVMPKLPLEIKPKCNLNHAASTNSCSAESLCKQTSYKQLFECNQTAPNSLNTHHDGSENCETIYQHPKCQKQVLPSHKFLSTKQYYENHLQSSSLDSKNPSSLLSEVESRSCLFVELPIITSGLSLSILQIMGLYKRENISLTVVLESNHLYHINVSVLYTSQCLGCVYATESALNEALENNFFDNFVTYFVLNSKNSVEERNKMLSYSLEFMNSSS